jgi:catechol 2,3-dioxygenase-like lactoylglutathione lyase family enzyme
VITKLDHVAVSVSDLDRSVEFYTQCLGCSLERVLDSGPESLLGKVVGMDGASARIAHLRVGEAMIELFEYRDPVGNPIPPDRRQADKGITHIGLTSDDARADYHRLAQRGVEFVSEPVEFRPGVWIFYFFGPDGEVCELRET